MAYRKITMIIGDSNPVFLTDAFVIDNLEEFSSIRVYGISSEPYTGPIDVEADNNLPVEWIPKMVAG